MREETPLNRLHVVSQIPKSLLNTFWLLFSRVHDCSILPTFHSNASLIDCTFPSPSMFYKFTYAFIIVGLVLILLTVLHGWPTLNILRATFTVGIGPGLALIGLLPFNQGALSNFLLTSWPLPTITVCYFVILIISHLTEPKQLFSRRKAVSYSTLKRSNNIMLRNVQGL